MPAGPAAAAAAGGSRVAGGSEWRSQPGCSASTQPVPASRLPASNVSLDAHPSTLPGAPAGGFHFPRHTVRRKGSSVDLRVAGGVCEQAASVGLLAANSLQTCDCSSFTHPAARCNRRFVAMLQSRVPSDRDTGRTVTVPVSRRAFNRARPLPLALRLRLDDVGGLLLFTSFYNSCISAVPLLHQLQTPLCRHVALIRNIPRHGLAYHSSTNH